VILSKQDDIQLIQKPIVVGIGASAGGLEAFQLFLKGLPDHHEMILVLIQHLDPDHHSLMPELVAAKTSSPVHSVKDNMKVEPGSIYLLPPGFEMTITNGHLKLEEFESPRGLRRPIDRFFRSLAKDCGENAIAVILSGTGSDGAEGAREVKGAGGLVFVQDPSEAKYDGMPQSVLDQGGADVVLRAGEIFEVVRDYFNLRVGSSSLIENEEEFLARIMRHVRFRTGHDFTDYKKGTMLRRIAVRMTVLNLNAPGDYLKYIAEHKEEADFLFRDLLINVTSFFRDPDYFDLLNRQIIPEIVENCEEHGEIRVWVAGCSTGEEAYSIAILLSEEVSRTKRNCKIVVFGTDIDEVALNKARGGHFADTIRETMPVAYLDTYFRPRNEGYEVGPQLREMVRFSRHSFIKDPPFSKLDMVCCRNVLIYFKENLQETAIKVFHYALSEKGYLFIGPSENPKPVEEYFSEISNRARIFKRRPGLAKPLNLGSLSGVLSGPSAFKETVSPVGNGHTDIERLLLERHVPAHLHIDRSGDVIFASDSATRFLKVRSGKMSNAINSMIAPEIESTVRRLCRLDAEEGSYSEREYQGKINGRDERLVLSTERLADASVLLVIEDNLQLSEERPGANESTVQQDGYVKELELELDEARRAVRTTVEELETSNEELKSSNEEMMSMNEELQSANEELTTINDELQEKLKELNQANNDLKNFTESARIATVFLDDKLQLKNYTPEAEQYFSFSDVDIGRNMADLNTVIDQGKLLELCHAVFEDQDEREFEFVTRNKKTYLSVRIMPYSPDGKAERGVVFTLQDVSELRGAIDQAVDMKKLAEERMNEVEQVYRTSPMAMALINQDMRYVRINEQMAQINQVSIEKHIGAKVSEIIPAIADHSEKLVEKVFRTKRAIRGERVTGNIKSEPDRIKVWECDWVP
jgi:two-component system CheB/CheR fusion protein